MSVDAELASRRLRYLERVRVLRRLLSRSRRAISSLANLAFLLGVTAAPSPAAALVFAVNSLTDAPDWTVDGVCETGPGNGVCTLRAAIEEANAVVGPLEPVEIVLPEGDVGLHDRIGVTGRIRVVGAGYWNSAIVPGPASITDFLLIGTTGNVELEGVTVANFTGPNFLFPSPILNGGRLVIRRSLLRANNGIQGGVIASGDLGSELLIEDSVLRSNTATEEGGSLYLFGCGASTIRRTHFESSEAPVGGAIFLRNCPSGETQRTTIADSYFTDNAAATGGAIELSVGGDLILRNSTIDQNRASDWGGGLSIETAARFRAQHVTITRNEADTDNDLEGTGGGLWASGTSDSAISGSIVSGNTGSLEITDPIPTVFRWPQDCAGAPTWTGSSIVPGNDQGYCVLAPAVLDVDPLLEEAAYNGGETRTRALPPGSPAINATPAGTCTDENGAPLSQDQRGAVRPFAALCDLGAFERGPLIFADGFESGTSSSGLHWSAIVP